MVSNYQIKESGTAFHSSDGGRRPSKYSLAVYEKERLRGHL